MVMMGIVDVDIVLNSNAVTKFMMYLLYCIA